MITKSWDEFNQTLETLQQPQKGHALEIHGTFEPKIRVHRKVPAKVYRFAEGIESIVRKTFPEFMHYGLIQTPNEPSPSSETDRYDSLVYVAMPAHNVVAYICMFAKHGFLGRIGNDFHLVDAELAFKLYLPLDRIYRDCSLALLKDLWHSSIQTVSYLNPDCFQKPHPHIFSGEQIYLIEDNTSKAVGYGCFDCLGLDLPHKPISTLTRFTKTFS